LRWIYRQLPESQPWAITLEEIPAMAACANFLHIEVLLREIDSLLAMRINCLADLEMFVTSVNAQGAFLPAVLVRSWTDTCQRAASLVAASVSELRYSDLSSWAFLVPACVVLALLEKHVEAKEPASEEALAMSRALLAFSRSYLARHVGETGELDSSAPHLYQEDFMYIAKHMAQVRSSFCLGVRAVFSPYVGILGVA
jgi:hypothetical protein